MAFDLCHFGPKKNAVDQIALTDVLLQPRNGTRADRAERVGHVSERVSDIDIYGAEDATHVEHC